jgi:hypothetical protein
MKKNDFELTSSKAVVQIDWGGPEMKGLGLKVTIHTENGYFYLLAPLRTE